MNKTKLEREWKKLSGDKDLHVEEVAGIFYGFTSRLGALELFHAYRNSNSGQHVGWSDTQNKWFFTMEFQYVS